MGSVLGPKKATVGSGLSSVERASNQGSRISFSTVHTSPGVSVSTSTCQGISNSKTQLVAGWQNH